MHDFPGTTDQILMMPFYTFTCQLFKLAQKYCGFRLEHDGFVSALPLRHWNIYGATCLLLPDIHVFQDI